MKNNTGFTYQCTKGTPYPLGVTRQDGGVNFCVETPNGTCPELLLYRPGQDNPCFSLKFDPEERVGNIFYQAVKDLPIEEYEYNYRFGEIEQCDPYAVRICGRDQFGMQPRYLRGHFTDDIYDWGDDVPLQIPYEEGILYTAHVREMTMDSSAHVRRKGTFAGVTERIPYLKELGINMLELMPVYEFAEQIPRKVSSMAYFQQSSDPKNHYRLNCWGYGAGHYFAPKASYAYSDNPGMEFKDMVRAFHEAGIEVILEFFFPDHTYPGLIIDCLKYWVLEYHVDGFHLSGFGLPLPMIAREPLLARTKLMGNGFQREEIYPDGNPPAFRNLAENNDGGLVDIRRFLKGDENQVGVFANRLRCNSSFCASINYAASHNGFTLLDMVSFEEKHNEANGEDNRDGSDYNFSCNYGEEGKSRRKKVTELRLRQMRNALLMVFLAQGVPCIQAGDECGNSKEGNNNAYCLDSPISWVQYGQSRTWVSFSKFVKKLIAFRKEHPVFRQAKELRGMDYRACGYPDISYHGRNVWYPQMDGNSRQLGVLYGGDYAEDGYFYVAYNMHPEEKIFALPNLPKGMKWHWEIDTGRAEEEIFFAGNSDAGEIDQKEIELKGRSIVVLQGRLPGGDK